MRKLVDQGISDLLLPVREQILAIARKHGVTAVKVFGSVARGDATEKSDIDLVIIADGPTPPWFPGGLVADLEALLQRRVNVVEPQALNEQIAGHIFQEAVDL